ncbi:protein of unknown function [Xenorhabdus poinarii G6]|uniref:Uncharacterized protein n=1 Tax=Xenorhabdus poinarii G6 TaxID=1354304 RepID=A0A068R0F3_9GAMM|nr:protein of unknown function [Xenorhabdus poinarii G6]
MVLQQTSRDMLKKLQKLRVLTLRQDSALGYGEYIIDYVL